MTLRGKDFCNCPHALMLLEAIEMAAYEAANGNVEAALLLLGDAQEEHKAAGDAWEENAIWHAHNNAEGV